MEEKDTYRTLSKPSEEILFKEKGSKFFGYAFPVTAEEDVNSCLELLKQNHKNARHFCYAYQFGTENHQYRANDDGEPSNSAGMPIYGQIQSFDVTDVLVVVVRYFGGTKLGVGGLISAYKTSAKETLEISRIVMRTINVKIEIKFDYKNMNKVMRIIKEKDLQIIEQKMELDCKILLSVRKTKAEEIATLFEAIYEVSIKVLS